MIWFVRIKRRFRMRASEWYCAAITFGFGLTLLVPGRTFNAPSYSAFVVMSDKLSDQLGFAFDPEKLWGYVFATVGFCWLAGLVVNGARQRATATIRAICSTFGFVTFGMLAVGFLLPFATFLFDVGWPTAMAILLGRIEPPVGFFLSTGVLTYFGASCLSLYNLIAVLDEGMDSH